MDAITTFERRRIVPHKLYGRIINASRDFTLIAVEDDFVFDGFQIIRNKDITRSGISDSNRYCTDMMKREGTGSDEAAARTPKIGSGILGHHIQRITSDVLIAENERVSTGFYIGPVVSVGAKDVTIHSFDGVGNWRTPETVPFAKMTTCRFMDRYSATHAKYLRWR